MRQKMTKRAGLLALALLTVGLGASLAATWGPPLDSRQENGEDFARTTNILAVRAEPIVAGDHFMQEIKFTGQLRAVREVSCSFERSGRVTAVCVAQGDHVRAGEVVARLDDRKLSALREETAARRAGAQAVFEELKSGPRQETIAAARAEVRRVQAQHELQQADLARYLKLAERQAASEREYEQAKFGADAARASLESAQTNLAELLAGTRQEKLDAQQAQVDQLDASLRLLDVELEDCVLRAPFQAIVVERLLDDGETVAPGDAVARLIEDRPCEAWIGMPVAAASRWQKGDRATVEVEDVDVPATVSAVLPEIDLATRTQTVVFQLDPLEADDAGDLRPAPGMLARVVTPQRIAADGFWTSASALTHGRRGLWAIAVAAPTDPPLLATVATRDVEVLYQDGDRAFVRGAVAAGELAIVEGRHRVVDGQPVRLLSAGESQ